MGERLWRALEYVLPEGFVLGRYFGDLNSFATGLYVVRALVAVRVSVVVEDFGLACSADIARPS